MEKVYIVTRGNYSDYQIHGVFTTIDKANDYMKSHEPYEMEFNEVEEFDLNPVADEVYKFNVNGEYPYRVIIKKGFEVSQAYLINPNSSLVNNCINGDVSYISEYSWQHEYNFYLLAKDRNHAIEIALSKCKMIVDSVGWGGVITNPTK